MAFTGVFTPEQLRQIRECAQANNSVRVAMLADDWDAPLSLVHKEYLNFREIETGHGSGRRHQASPATQQERAMRSAVDDLRGEPARPPAAPGRVLQPLWRANTPDAPAPLAHVQPVAGAFAQVTRNWPLFSARAASGLSLTEVARQVGEGLTGTYYGLIEDGCMLPTDVWAERICHLFNLPREKTFFATAPRPQKGSRLRGTTLLELLMVQRRLNNRQLLELLESRGHAITQDVLTRVRKENMPAPIPEHLRVQLQTLAEFFGVAEGTQLMAKIPLEVLVQVAAQTERLHRALKAEQLDHLAALDNDPRRMLGAGGDKK